MKILITSVLFITAILLQARAIAQSPSWQHSTNWTLYNLGGTKFYHVKVDSLANYPSRNLNDDSMRLFLSGATDLASDKPPVWMGAYVVTCLIDGQKKKIDISTYGGFFFDERTNKYYTVPQQFQKIWLDYLASCTGALSSSK